MFRIYCNSSGLCYGLLDSERFGVYWLTYVVRHRPGVAKFFDRGGALQEIFEFRKILGIAAADLL
jgi:hypothetical protein